ncbi:ATP-binding protein [Endozoicomonadaceae bacterium StTr2]
MPLSKTIEQINLNSLNNIRLIILLTELAGLVFASLYFTEIRLNWAPLLIVSGTGLLLISYTFFNSRHQRGISYLRLFKQLLADIMLQTLFFYWCGGYTNPFIFVYLVTVAISAALLPVKQRWLITTLCIVCYTLLQKWYHPLVDSHSAHNSLQPMFIMHLAGMWLTFSVCACLVTGVVARMADTVRAHKAEITASREQLLRNERILAVATTAAGAAHELGTPLSTMSVLLGEMAEDDDASAQLKDDIRLLGSQVKLCKERLNKIVQSSRNQDTHIIPARDFILSLLDEWQLMRPEIPVGFDYSASPVCQIETDQSLMMAMINLLDNAADASPDYVKLGILQRQDIVVLQIEDRGPGIDQEIARHPGITTFSTKKEGMGLGLQLSVATIERLNGTVHIYSAQSECGEKPAGTITEVRFPEISNRG